MEDEGVQGKQGSIVEVERDQIMLLIIIKKNNNIIILLYIQFIYTTTLFFISFHIIVFI